MRILTAFETDAPFYPAVDLRVIYHGEDAVETRDRGCVQVGYPKTIQVDNRSQFISRALDLWAYANDVPLHFSRFGNGVIEAFSGKLRSECLSGHWFIGLADARDKWETGRRHCNEETAQHDRTYLYDRRALFWRRSQPVAMTEPGSYRL